MGYCIPHAFMHINFTFLISMTLVPSHITLCYTFTLFYNYSRPLHCITIHAYCIYYVHAMYYVQGVSKVGIHFLSKKTNLSLALSENFFCEKESFIRLIYNRNEKIANYEKL